MNAFDPSQDPTALWDEHVAAWASLNAAGIDIEPASSDPGDVARAADVASHARSSQVIARLAPLCPFPVDVYPSATCTMDHVIAQCGSCCPLQYFLYSSLRDDHFPGISPGGLSTENYQARPFTQV